MLLKLHYQAVKWLQIAVHLLCLGWILNQYYRGINDNLGGDPVKELIHSTGTAALTLLLLSLLISTAALWLRNPHIVKLRRPIGLYAYAYGCCHVSSYAWLELQLNVSDLLEDILLRPYITVGLAALLILSVLAATSIGHIRRRLDSKWQVVHGYVYPCVILVLVHYLWSVKSIALETLLYALATAIVLLLRRVQIKYWIKKQFHP